MRYQAIASILALLNKKCAGATGLKISSGHRLASIPNQKGHSNMLAGKDKSRPACINAENLAQVAPIDSFSRCSKSRIAFGRELIQDIGKNAR